MRAAAILGPGSSSKAVVAFQRKARAEWTSLIEQADIAVIFGGDGTIHHHLRELVELEIPVLVVPCGSGNDFARALGIRSVRDSVDALREFERDESNLRQIDLGVVCDPGAPGGRPRYFCSVAGVGIDGNIVARANQLPSWIRGHGGYALCAPGEFVRFAPVPMKIAAGSSSGAAKPTVLAAIANASAYGGGMKIAPQAKLADGKLELCVVRAMHVLKLFCLFPTVYFGKHLGFKEVEYSQVDSVRVETEHPMDVYADGEYVCQTPVQFGIAPGALTVLTGAAV